jgi:hypothetical protein
VIRGVAFCTAALFWVMGAQDHDASAVELVSIRVTPSVPDSVIDYIARNSEPALLDIRINERPETFINGVCGAYTKTFENVFYELNNKLARQPDTKSSRQVRMPACVKWVRDVPIVVRPNDTIEKLIESRIGRGVADRLNCEVASSSPRCGKSFLEIVQQANRGVDLADLKPGAVLSFPFVTFRKTFRVKDDSGLTAKQVVDEIAALDGKNPAGSSVIENYIASEVRLVAADEVNPSSPECVDARAKTPSGWPYDAALVAQVIAKTHKINQQRQLRLKRALVTVVDTGLDDNTFPKSYLHEDPLGGSRRSHKYGRGIQFSTQIAPFPDYEAHLHGTHVAEILTGGSGLRAALPLLSDLLRINIVNLVTKSGSKHELTDGGVIQGVQYAISTSADVVNLSIGSEEHLDEILNLVASRSMLLVVAAGNELKKLELNKPVYPAMYGGESAKGGTQFITVAAHQAGGGLAREFSNWSAFYADLAAPGCAVPFSQDPNAEVLHGTSFAAPLVAMTAGLLKAFGVEMPYRVKRRLEASTDYVPQLDGVVAWSGSLNIAKALSLHEDVLEIRQQPLMFGTWDVTENFVQLCASGPETEFRYTRVKKITSISDSAPYMLRILIEDGEGRLHKRECEAAGAGLQFTPSDGTSRSVTWQELRDLVPRMATP